MDHASKEIFVNHFKIISSQDENVRDEAIEKGLFLPANFLLISSYSVGNGLSQFIRRAEDKSNYFIGDRPGYVEACMVPFAWHTHLAKGWGETTV